MSEQQDRLLTFRFVFPFVLFLILLAVRDLIAGLTVWEYGLRSLIAGLSIIAFSRNLIVWRPAHPLWSAALGVLVFAVWVAPDVMSSSYRDHWIFQNSFTGNLGSSAPNALQASAWSVAFRVSGSTLIIPIIEELFWRGWLMRFIITTDFQKVPFGSYSAASFWTTAFLFASEHGPFWDVGLLAGILYNWWIIRTRSLADCILAHAVTNGCLAGYVLLFKHWEYWL